MSMFVKEYNKANKREKERPVFYQTINVSLLDILSQAEVEVEAKDYKECLCHSSTNKHNYFVECDKCHASGIITLNGHEVTCNKCHGEKNIRIHDCYICNNHNKILLDSKIKIKLKKSYKEDDEIILEYQDYKLILKLHIYDLKEYEIKNNDIYKLTSVVYTKDDYKEKVSKQIKVINGTEYIKSEFKKKKEIVQLKNKGIGNGDFYFIFENELENDKEIVYTNVLLDNTGYVNPEELINKEVVVGVTSVSLDSSYIYIDNTTDKIETEEYLVYLNILNKNEFEYTEELCYVLNLKKEDLLLDKKAIEINSEKVNVVFKKNLKEASYFKVNNKVLVDKQGKKKDLIIKINPYFENIYKISIKKNKNAVYVEDYKYHDYRVVEGFKKDDYLDKYIKIKDEDRVYIDDDVILIKRV